MGAAPRIFEKATNTEVILEHRSNDPAFGYNWSPRFAG
jgi:hypothetical protein